MNRHGFTDRLLHRFALRSRAFRRFCFERECERNGLHFEPLRENLFIAGVARSGSTTLLNCLYQCDAFASTCYRHMPFVMAPSLSNILAAVPRKTPGKQERRHGDSIHIDLDSPEALDGVFWSTYLGRDENWISPRAPGDELLDRYAMFIENLLVHGARERYLTKMNQRIDLLPALVHYFRNSLFLLPFRDPLQQARSLLRQHHRFTGLSTYETGYLQWLGHREFGDTHLGFIESSHQTDSRFPINSLDYWLDQWHRVYSYLSGLVDLHPELIPLSYEDLAASPDTWRRLSSCIGADLSGDRFHNRNNTDIESVPDFNTGLTKKCQALYARLLEQSGARLC